MVLGSGPRFSAKLNLLDKRFFMGVFVPGSLCCENRTEYLMTPVQSYYIKCMRPKQDAKGVKRPARLTNSPVRNTPVIRLPLVIRPKYAIRNPITPGVFF